MSGQTAERAALRAGARSIGGTVIGTVAWGAVTGVALVKSGLAPHEALGMVMLVYSGTAQLAALPLLAASAPLFAIWVTALLANLRFVVYSATVSVEFRDLPLARRLFLGWMTTDTGLAVYLAGRAEAGLEAPPVSVRAARFLGTNGTVYLGWTVGTAVGVAAAGLIPDSPRIAFIGVLAILALIGPMLSARPALAAAMAAGVVATLGRDWPWRAGTFAAIAAGVATAVWISARSEAPSR